MSVEIISTGNEVMSGLTLDTNFNWAASRLSEIGITVDYHTAVKDDLDDLISSFKIANKRAEVVIITGGLGPTEDDLSCLAASRFLDSELVFNESVYESIINKLKQRGRESNENHKLQSRYPSDCEILENPVGTAPGFRIQKNETVFFFLPGVPREFKPMFTGIVLPELDSILSKGSRLIVKNLKTFGLGESEVAERLKGLGNDEIKIGYRIKLPEVHLRIVSSIDSNESEERLHNLISEIRNRLGDYLFSDDEETLEEVTAKLLIEKNLTIATAESCTGGLIANRLTNIGGSSKYFLRGVISYSNESKVDMLSVDFDNIEKFGAVSSIVVEQMAEGVRKLSGSDIGIGISGIAGPSGGTEEKPVGTVFIGFSYKDGAIFSNKYIFNGSRLDIKQESSSTAIDLVRKFCINNV